MREPGYWDPTDTHPEDWLHSVQCWASLIAQLIKEGKC